MTIDFEAKQLHMSTPGRVALKRLNHAVGIAFFVHTEQDLLAMMHPTSQNMCPGSPLLWLPMEILMVIFGKANDMDQLALALSCKHLLQVSTLVPLKPSACAISADEERVLKPQRRSAEMGLNESKASKDWDNQRLET
ncbi:hypothetical protein V491_06429 [Pseudogymnoascus sp. VKM F-3775]|nr:hypothetical protein V491_06429 [Pseudogymnoascus sp. VKM F-3775]